MTLLHGTLSSVLILAAMHSAAADDRVDFDTDVMPVLTRSGCNVGACHGAAAGRGEFFLSLYGSRPQADFEQITRSLGGRRIRRGQPSESLLLRKATEQISHEGGARIEYDSADHQTLIRWIAQGARRDGVRRLTDFRLRAGRRRLDVGESTQLQATAQFDDGLERDVNRWTIFQADDPSAVALADGRATVQRPGRHVLSGRYLDQVVTLELIVPYPDPKGGQTLADAGPVDRWIEARLSELNLPAQARAPDAVLLRRLFLDLTGRLPTEQDRQAFLQDPAGTRVEQLIARLTAPADEAPAAFDRYWAYVLAQQLQAAAVGRGQASRESYYHWLEDALRRNVGYDTLAAALLTASGPADVPQTGFYRTVRGPNATTELVSRAFLGVRLQCANCHDHPLDRWTQEDYHGLAAVFAGLRVGESISVGQGSVINPATGDPAVPQVPGGAALPGGDDLRTPLAFWLASRDNPLFARAFVNRVWARLMGRGLVEPIDDLRDTNPATHPELLQWLAEDFAAHDFQIRHLVRTICRSRAYQRAAFPAATPLVQRPFYGGALHKKMSPEVFADAVAQVVKFDAPGQVSYAGLAARGGDNQAMVVCQGPECESLSVATSDLAVQLDLVNGATINGRLAGGALLSELQDASDELCVQTVYRRALNRFPQPVEAAFWQEQLAADDRAAVLQDFLWSVLTSQEFLTSH